MTENIFDKEHFLRHVLASCLEVPINEISIGKTFHGKPYLLNKDHAFLKFNISHKDPWLVVAISNYNEIGIDIEDTSNRVDLELLKRKVLSPSECIQPMTKRLLYKIWTIKEAFVKALGIGLHYPLQLIETSWNNQSIQIKSINDPRLYLKHISLEMLPSWDTNFVGHFVVFGEIQHVHVHQIF